jgi:preprotein translocase subunit SecB
MADQPPSSPLPGAAAPLAMNLQYVKDLSFESPRAPQVFVQQGPQSQVNVNVRVDGRGVGENTYEIVLHLEVSAKAGEDPVFLLELAYGGIVTTPALPPEQLSPLLMIEAPRMLFPFARQVVSNTIAGGGFPPLLINPIDFADLYRRQLQAAQATPGQAGTA